MVADYYYTGKGVTGDRKQAIHWLKLAADRGNSDAQCRLGRYYDTGTDGVVQNKAEARRYTQLAAEQGHPGALGGGRHKGRTGDKEECLIC